MFGNHRKRQRASSNPALHPHAPPNSSASLAATKAFMRSHDSNASLSSSAAAAALRTHPTAPIQVGQTVTKRMARKGSMSSQGSGSQHAPGLRRHSSSGSMTERTFREASPARSSPIDPDAPPVPQLPQDVPQTAAVHRRASSLEPAYRGGSPIGRGGGRGVSLDRGVAGTAGRIQPRALPLAQVPEDVRQNSQQSINFSRPISPVQTSSPKAPVSGRGGHTGWFGGPVVNPGATFRGAAPRPQTSGGNSAFEAHATQQAIQNAANRPVATKKAPMSQGLEGARLASGSLRAKQNPYATQSRQVQPAATYRDPPRTVDPNSPFAVYDPSTRTFIHKQDAMALHRAISDAEDPPPRYEHDLRGGSQTRQPERRLAQHQQALPQSKPQRTSHHGGLDQASAPALQTKPSTNRIPAPSALDVPPGVTLARRSSEDFADDDDVRPVADTNTSSNLEASVSEGANNIHQPQSPKLASNQDSPYPRVSSVAVTSQNGASVTPTPNRVRAERTHSLSPPRNAHFAAVSLEMSSDFKHQPPPRSVSPAKSALKSSPSVSRRGHSPIANDGHLPSQGPGSEASDAISEDGSKKKKKAVRVSFDEEPVVAGTSAYADVATELPNQGLAASRWSPTSPEQDFNDFMKPRPVLPSFGSIRDKDRRSREGDAPEKVTETVSSSLSNSGISTSEQTGTSSDHLVGGILAQDFASKIPKLDPQDPLPPEVTSVEGSGYVSDSDQSEASDSNSQTQIVNDTGAAKEKNQSMPEPEPKTLAVPTESRIMIQEVPSIAVQPASPSPTEKPEPKYQHPFLPGGWDDDDGPEPEPAKPTPAQPETQPRTTTISFANMETLNSQYQDSDSSDDSSIYSDAYEDLSEVEDGGFASIDAVLESPLASPPSGLMASKFADPTTTDPQNSSLRHEYKDDIERAPSDQASRQQKPLENTVTQAAATAKDSPLKSQPRSEPAAVSDRQVSGRSESGASVAAPQPRKSAMKKSTATRQGPSHIEPTHLRTTMRDTVDVNAIAGSPRMKKSMREPASLGSASPSNPAMRKTMRGPGSAGATQSTPGLAASRYSVPPIDTKTPRGALQKRHIPATASANRTAQPRKQSLSTSIPSKTTPTPAYDSDSDASASSFQRSRPRATRRENGRYTMRASMRSGPTPTMRATAPSMRPTSPLQTTSPPPTMRKSMRPSSPPVEVSVNGGTKPSKFRIRSLSPAGRFRPKSTADIPPLPTQTSPPKKTSMFGKSSKSKKPAAEPSKPRFKSRFADSSDEEDDRPRAFQSRFADSDDDDEFELPSDLAPVRGIPKRPGEEDRESTDLEEELSDAEPSPQPVTNGKVEATNGITNGTTNGQSANFAAGSLRTSKHAPALSEMEAGKKAKSKRGFFGLGKKKGADSYIESDPGLENGAATDIPLPPKPRRDPNRPLTPIGEDKDVEPSRPTTRAPKLQRRTAPQFGRSASDSWPLPESSVNGDDARPQSSDGVVNRRLSLRPSLNKRHSSQTSQAHTMVEQGTEKSVIVGRSGKKKKFQGLRRVFGLND